MALPVMSEAAECDVAVAILPGGEGVSGAEQAVRASMGATPARSESPISCCRVPGGLTNENWRVSFADGRNYFVKLPGRGSRMFISRGAAHEASRRAEACGVGAKVVAFLPEDGVEIFEFAEGFRASSNADFLRGPVRHNAAAALRAFNDSASLSLTKTVFDQIEEHVVQVAAVGGRVPADYAPIMHRFAEARSAFIAAGLDLAPCMNDTLAGNFMLDADDRVMLVDLEYAANNERSYELALWFLEMGFEPDVEREMLEAYYGRLHSRVDARISVMKALGDLKWAMWAAIQEAVSIIDFDFCKYGAWKYRRARTFFFHPDWYEWLKRL